jgi:hypothetical protein
MERAVSASQMYLRMAYHAAVANSLPRVYGYISNNAYATT